MYEGKFLRFIDEDSWEYVERHNCSDIVVVWAMTDDKKVIFIEQYRPALKKRVVEYPAGLVNDKPGEPHESIEDAAKRELFEEAGYTAERIVKVMDGPVASGITPGMLDFLHATGIKKEGPGGGADADEDIEVHEIPLDEAADWLEQKRQSGVLVGPKIYTGLYYLERL